MRALWCQGYVGSVKWLVTPLRSIPLHLSTDPNEVFAFAKYIVSALSDATDAAAVAAPPAGVYTYFRVLWRSERAKNAKTANIDRKRDGLKNRNLWSQEIDLLDVVEGSKAGFLYRCRCPVPGGRCLVCDKRIMIIPDNYFRSPFVGRWHENRKNKPDTPEDRSIFRRIRASTFALFIH